VRVADLDTMQPVKATCGASSARRYLPSYSILAVVYLSSLVFLIDLFCVIIQGRYASGNQSSTCLPCM